jgi:hypothetical protein
MVNKAAAAGIIFFAVVLAGFVGIKVDQSTIALLGGAFIGLVVAIPTTALIMIIGLKPRNTEQGQVHMPPQPPPVFPQQQLPSETHNHYHQNNYVVVVHVPPYTANDEKRFIVARELRVLPSEAQRMIDAGEVRLLPAGK